MIRFLKTCCLLCLLSLSLSAQEPAEQATNFTGNNADWQVVTQQFDDDPLMAEMVLVPVGTFMMGADDSNLDQQPIHEQTIETPFWLDKYEITRGQYQQCINADICTETLPSQYSTADDQPINNVTWYQAQTFCEWRGMRLPTEIEWEFAARGVDSWRYPWGDEWNPDNVVYFYNSGEVTAPVGSRPQGASWVGALDMSGNVYEWTDAYFLHYPLNEDSTGYKTRRMLRGGAFGSYLKGTLTGAMRFWHNPDAAFDGSGIRCAFTLE